MTSSSVDIDPIDPENPEEPIVTYNLAAIPGDVRSVETLNSEGRIKVRDMLDQVLDNIDVSYLALGALLYRVSKGGYYVDYGFSSFEEFVADELGFKERKAAYYIAIYKKFLLELSIGETEFRNIGWSKAAVIASVADDTNVLSWLAKAREMSHKDLVEAVREHKESKKTKAAQEKAIEDADGDFIPDDNSDLDEEEADVLKTLKFSVFPGQLDVVERTFERASEVVKSQKPGHLLETICIEYLSMHPGTEPPSLAWWVSKLEAQHGCRIIAAKSDKELLEVAQSIIEEFKN